MTGASQRRRGSGNTLSMRDLHLCAGDVLLTGTIPHGSVVRTNWGHRRILLYAFRPSAYPPGSTISSPRRRSGDLLQAPRHTGAGATRSRPAAGVTFGTAGECGATLPAPSGRRRGQRVPRVQATQELVARQA